MAFTYTGFADEAAKPLAKQIEVTKRAGWSSIELRLIEGKNVCDMNDAEWAKVWSDLQEAGITVAGFGGQIANWARPITADFQQDVDELRRAAPHMREAGTKLIRIMSYPNDEKNPLSRSDWRQEATKRLKELATIAEGEGVILGHENCSGYGGLGPNEYMELATAIDSPAFKLIFDTGNNSVHDGDVESTWRFYEGCRKEIIHVHIKAYKPADNGKLETCYPDEDPVQKRILSDLKQTGYDSWISIEPHLAAAVHAGKDVTDEEKNSAIYLEYTRRLEALVDSL